MDASCQRAPPCLRIRLLGDFRVDCDGVPVDGLARPRCQALLAYLLLHREAAQFRRHLAFLLWPDSSEAQALTNLRHVLHDLLAALPNGGRWLTITPQTLQWDIAAPFDLDLTAFERDTRAGASSAELQMAVDLYRGDLLPACYDDWILPERERLLQAYLSALERLAALREAEGAFGSAIELARHLLSRDPLREASYRLLMRLHVLNGDRGAALHVYHACASVLQEELGVTPDPSTRRQYEQLMDLEDLAAPGAVQPAGRLPLVGRDGEWLRLLGAWRAAEGAGPQIVLLSGEPGMGKSRLAEELLEWAVRQRIACAYARCYAAEGDLPYAPVTAWLRALPALLAVATDASLTEVARLVPQALAQHPDLPSPGPLAEAWQRSRFFDALARTLLGPRRPLLLVIDDLQWCDRDTLEWLHFFLRYDTTARLLVLGTARPEALQPQGRLPLLLAALRAAGRLTEIELGPLNEADTALLGGRVAGRSLEKALAEHLYRETGGNPLFVSETVRAHLAGLNVLGLPGSSPTTLAPRVQAVMAGRLAGLPPAARDLAGLAAVVGRAFTVDLLRRAAALSDEMLVPALDELWRGQIVRELAPGASGAYDFSHDRLREVIYGGLSPVQRQALHRRVAETLAAEPKADQDSGAAIIAAHYEQAGLRELALRHYRTAARAARRAYANDEAARLLERALALAGGVADAAGIVAGLQEDQGDMLALAGRYASAREAYGRALSQIGGDERAAAARIERKTGNTWAAQHQPIRALQTLSLAEAKLRSVPGPVQDDAWRQEWIALRIDQIWTSFLVDRPDEMQVLIEETRPVVERHGTPEQQARFYADVVRAQMRRYRYVISDDILATAQAALSASQHSTAQHLLPMTTFLLGVCRMWRGELAGAEVELQGALALAERTGDWEVRVLSLTSLAVVCRRRGQVGEVRRYAADALAAATRADMPFHVACAWANQAWIAWREGDSGGAEARAREALRLWHTLPIAQSMPWLALWLLVAILVGRDELAEAVSFARALFDPPQQPLPALIAASVEMALAAWDRGETAEARTGLGQALEVARELGYT